MEHLQVDDAPWLTDRVNYDKIDMAHDLLTSSHGSSNSCLVELLNFRRLSSVVSEVLFDGFIPCVSQPQPQELIKFNHVLRSVAFRNGIRQVIRHEREATLSKRRGGQSSGGGGVNGGGSGSNNNNNSGSNNDNSGNNSGEVSSTELLRRLFLLESVTVVGCNGIQISYYVDGIDVTSTSSSSSSSTSDYLLIEDHDEQLLYIDTSTGGGRIWVNCVVMAIKHVNDWLVLLCFKPLPFSPFPYLSISLSLSPSPSFTSKPTHIFNCPC